MHCKRFCGAATAARPARYAAGLLTVFLLCMAGCGGESLPPTVRLAGTVTLNGKNLTDARITLYPTDKPGGATVGALILDGQFTLPTVPVGSYKAAFTTNELSENQAPAGPIDSGFNAPKAAGRPKASGIPERYRKPSVPVDAGKDDATLRIELKGD